MEKKHWLVDVPVMINIWIRPECQREQFEVIKQARPSILFVTSDGGRNKEEWEIINRHREMYDNEIDWDCTVYRLYSPTNYGMYTMEKMRCELIWSHVDRCICLEDDQIPSVSYFRFCAELLEKYKNDERICCICGMNHLGVSENVSSDYFFSRQGSIWGVALWKRTCDLYYDYEYGKDSYTMKLLKQRTRHNKSAWKRINAYAKNTIYEGHEASSEFFLELAMYAHNQVQIIPQKNMISNIGCSSSAAHSDSLKNLPRGIRKVFNMKTYEIEFPLKHPKYVIPDIDYEKKRNRIMGYNYPLIDFVRKMERICLLVQSGNIKGIVNRIKKRFLRQIEN